MGPQLRYHHIDISTKHHPHQAAPTSHAITARCLHAHCITLVEHHSSAIITSTSPRSTTHTGQRLPASPRVAYFVHTAAPLSSTTATLSLPPHLHEQPPTPGS